MPPPIASLLLWPAFILAYVALDWASYLHALHGLNITPWNPSLSLALVCWLRYGKRTAIPWFAALLLGELVVRGLPASLSTTLLISGALVAGYGAIAETLRRYVTTSELLTDQRHLLIWLAIVVVGTLLTSCLYITLLLAADLLPVSDGLIALRRFWIGDCVGIVVTMPFLTMLFGHRDRLWALLLHWETAAYGALCVGMLWIAFGLGGSGEFQYFYLLFLPIVWAAARQGMAGASIAAFVLQAGIVAAVEYLNLIAVTVLELQMLGAALAFVGFFIGVVIDEKQRARDELQRTLRLAAAGEMAGALAHELNQPLTALSAYGTACEQLLQSLGLGGKADKLRETIHCMVAESFRAADVVRRLRDFFRTGATALERIELSTLLDSVQAHFTGIAQRKNVALIVTPAPVCTLLVDRLQIEVVLRNLLANALDATLEATVVQRENSPRHIRLSAYLADEKHICLCIEDSGSGLSPSAIARLFEAFQSSKASGLGLGLTISRAIAEAHGGTLIAETANHGVFKLILPIED